MVMQVVIEVVEIRVGREGGGGRVAYEEGRVVIIEVTLMSMAALLVQMHWK